jgi:hypothetical protein
VGSLASVVWIPSLENCLLGVGKNGSFGSMFVQEQSIIQWNPRDELAISDGRGISFMSVGSTSDTLSTRTKSSGPIQTLIDRATNRYGLASSSRGDSDSEDLPIEVADAWFWLKQSEALSSKGSMQSHGVDCSFIGILSLLQTEFGLNTTDPTDLDASPSRRPVSIGAGDQVNVKSTAAMLYTAALNTQTTFIPISPATTRAAPTTSSAESRTLTTTDPTAADVHPPVTQSYSPTMMGNSAYRVPSSPGMYTTVLGYEDGSAPMRVFQVSKLVTQRRLCLALCGWDLGLDDGHSLEAALNRSVGEIGEFGFILIFIVLMFIYSKI